MFCLLKLAYYVCVSTSIYVAKCSVAIKKNLFTKLFFKGALHHAVPSHVYVWTILEQSKGIHIFQVLLHF